MKILILGINYAPEPVGIGPYTTGLAQSLVEAGHEVRVVCGKPYYPAWKADPAFAGGGARRSVEEGVQVIRLPHYVPAHPSGARRLIHHASFTAYALPMLLGEILRDRPDLIIGIAPSLISLTAGRIGAALSGARYWIHLQDFEVEAAFATGLLAPKGLVARLARRFEGWNLKADRISTISPQMCRKLIERGIPPERVIEFRNWADIDRVRPLQRPSVLREQWGIDRPHVALYSGNIANKQGIEIIVEAARLLTHRRDLMFAICGGGPNRANLMAMAEGLDNIRFFDLQPVELLPELVGLATVHLLPQIAGAADLLLPSKLTNMLASGRPVVATATAGTSLAQEVEGCGLATPPGDAAAFAGAIAQLIDDEPARIAFGAAARARAEERWSKRAILAKLERDVTALAPRPAVVTS